MSQNWSLHTRVQPLQGQFTKADAPPPGGTGVRHHDIQIGRQRVVTVTNYTSVRLQMEPRMNFVSRFVVLEDFG